MHSIAIRPENTNSHRPGLLLLVYGLGLVKFVLPFLLQDPGYEPHRDEFLFIAEGQHLAWALESPPLLPLLSGISDLVGGGFFWIKFWPALFGAMTFVLVGRMILLFGGGRLALLLGFLPFVFGIFLRMHFTLSPDFLAAYFETLMVYGVVRAIRTGKTRRLYLAGLGFGLGVFSQYMVVLFAGWLVVGLFLGPERKLLKSRHFLFGFLMSLLFLIPMIAWQGLHDWPAIGVSGRGGGGGFTAPGAGGMIPMEPVRNVFLFNLPGVFIWAAGLFWVFGTAAGKKFRWVGWMATGVILTVVFWGRRAEEAMGVYPVLFGFGAVMIGGTGSSREGRPGGGDVGWWKGWRVGWCKGWRVGWCKGWRAGLRVVVVAFTLLAGGVLDTVFLPMLPPKELVRTYSRVPLLRQLGLLRWQDRQDHALPRYFADMLGWEEMAIKVARAYESLDSLDKTGVLLNGGGNCGETGALDYYGQKYSLPPVMGCRANYVLWTPAAYYDRDVYIVTTPDRGSMKNWAAAVITDSVTHPYSAEYKSYIMIVRGPSAAMRQGWKQSYRVAHRQQLASR
jgi:hypothetical protein